MSSMKKILKLLSFVVKSPVAKLCVENSLARLLLVEKSFSESVVVEATSMMVPISFAHARGMMVQS